MSIKSPKKNTATYQEQKSCLFRCQFVARIVKTCLASTKNYFRVPLILSCSTSLSVRPPRMTTMMVVMMVVKMGVERWIFWWHCCDGVGDAKDGNDDCEMT